MASKKKQQPKRHAAEPAAGPDHAKLERKRHEVLGVWMHERGYTQEDAERGERSMVGSDRGANKRRATPCSFKCRPGTLPDGPALLKAMWALCRFDQYWLGTGKFNWTKAAERVAQDSGWKRSTVKQHTQGLKGLRRERWEAAQRRAAETLDLERYSPAQYKHEREESKKRQARR